MFTESAFRGDNGAFTAKRRRDKGQLKERGGGVDWAVDTTPPSPHPQSIASVYHRQPEQPPPPQLVGVQRPKTKPDSHSHTHTHTHTHAPAPPHAKQKKTQHIINYY